MSFGQSVDNPEIIAPSSEDDGDTAPPTEVILSVDRQSVTEGESVTVTATLNDALDQAVTIPLDYPTDGASAVANLGYTPFPELTITAGRTTLSGTIETLTDALKEGEETFTVALGALPPDVVGGRVLSHTIIIVDHHQPPEVSLSVDRNPVDEGEITTITVTLSGPLSDDATIPVTLTPVTASREDVEVLTSLSPVITSGETEAEISIRAVDDDLIEGSETFTVALGSLPTTVAEGTPSAIEITINDTDEARLNAPESVVILEGNQETIEVSLTAIPSSEVSVEITGYEGTDLSVSPTTTLVFSPDRWDQPQELTLIAGEDDDFLPDEVFLRMTASGGGYSGVTHTLEVTIIDGNQPGLVVQSSVLINEGGEESFDVRLAQQPTDAVTVLISGTTGTDLVLQSTSVLKFSVSDWDQNQSVDLMAEEDPDAEPDAPVQLLLNASAGGYDGLSETVTVTIQENDQVGMVVEPTSLRIDEGESDVLSVYLTAQPSANVTVDISGFETSDLMIPSPSETFTPSGWQSPKEFTLEAGTDPDIENDEIRLTISATGGGYSGQQEEVQVTIVDQGLPKITIYDAQAKEDDGIIRLPVELSHTTDQVVTVQYASTDQTATAAEDYIQCRGLIRFTPGIAREMIEFMIIDDAELENTETFRVTLANATHSVIVRPSATATIIDNDGTATKRKSNPDHVSYNQNTCAGLDAFPSDLTVPEGSSNEVYIRLYGAPPSEVIISTSDHKDLLIEPKTLIFTAQNWDRLQAMTLTAAEDIDAINDTFIVNLYASGEMYNDVQSEVFVIISDDDSTGIVLKSNTITVTEGSFTHFELRLTSEPSSDVMVNMDARGDLTLDPTDLTFTATNWANLQSVMVKANEDNDIDNDIETLLLTASGGDYDLVTHEVIVTVEDNDVAGIAISPNTLTVPEGSAQEFIVQLNTAPSGNVLLTIPDGENMVPSPKVVAFTAQNWNEAQSINIVASEDENQENDQEILILTGAGAEYAGITQQLSITIVDNDLSRINLNPDLPQTAEEPTTGTIYDGESTELQIVLAQKPIANVTVEISSSNTFVKISPSTLTFTPSNWEMEQTIIITSQENNQTISDERVVDDHLKHGGSFQFNREVVLTLIASGGGYDGVSQQRQFTIIDQSNVNIQLSETSPVSVQLWGNYPNPFSTMTNIAFDLPAPAQISLIVTDLLGRTVMYIPDQWYGLGQHQTLQIQGGELPSGVYYYRLEVNIDGKITGHTKPMLIIR